MPSFTDKHSFGIQTSEEEINEHFAQFLRQLRNHEPLVWGILDRILRKRTIPWLCKKLSNSSKYRYDRALQTAEDIYAESIEKYVQLFTNGSFEGISNLISLMYSVMDLKLKERYRKITKDNKFVFTDNEEWLHSFEDPSWDEEAQNAHKNDNLQKMKKHLSNLSERDRMILLRFANGEKLKDIANSLEITEATCRKQKERALKRLKKSFFSVSTKTLMSITWLINL